MLIALLFFTGLTIDFGNALLSKRRLQAATDMAALAASQHITNAQPIAVALMSANSFPASAIATLTSGTYTADPKLQPASRYMPGLHPANAVAITGIVHVPMRFISALVPNAQVAVGARAGALQITEAGLVAGSGVASVGAGLPNALLGGLLGTQLSLDAVSYEGLANANVNALTFLNALATQANVTTGTYGQLLSGSLSMGQIISAAITALNAPGSVGTGQLQATQALQAINAQLNGSPTVALGTLVSAGLWNTAQIGTINRTSALQADLNVYQLVSFAAQIANGAHDVTAPAAIDLPGVAVVDISTTAIEPPQGSYFAVGPTGTTVHTSQIRLQLTMHVAGSLALPPSGPAPVNLPIYEEVASGTATVTGISCGATPSQDAIVDVAAQSGLSTAYVGQVSASAMTNTTQPVVVSPAVLVMAGVEQVTGQAVVSAQGNTQALTFNQQEVAAQMAQTISSTGMAANLLSTLQSKLVLQGTPLPLPTVGTLLNPILAPAFAALDSVSDQILRTLGMRVGYLDVTVTGVRCGVPALFE